LRTKKNQVIVSVGLKMFRKAILLVLLISLIVLELYFCTAFLPVHWQHSINDAISSTLPRSTDWTPITHPLLAQEIDQGLRENTWLRIAMYLITSIFLATTAWLIRRVWQLLAGSRNANR
jgi:hypothetical protein